jgi:hypothetical protein
MRSSFSSTRQGIDLARPRNPLHLSGRLLRLIQHILSKHLKKNSEFSLGFDFEIGLYPVFPPCLLKDDLLSPPLWARRA